MRPVHDSRVRMVLACLVAAWAVGCGRESARLPLVPGARLADLAAAAGGRREPGVATIDGTTRYVMGDQEVVPLTLRTKGPTVDSDADGTVTLVVECPPQGSRPHDVTIDLMTMDRSADVPLQRKTRHFGSLCEGAAGTARTVRVDGLRPARPFIVTATLSMEPASRVSSPVVEVPLGSELRFALGIRSEGVIATAPVPVRLIAAAPDGRTRELERRTVPASATAVPGGWHEWRVPLDAARAALGSRLAFTLEAASRTSPDGFVHVLWGNPIVWSPRPGPRPPERRSVILVSLDTLRADRFGVTGYPLDLTPNFDRVAREGTLFTDVVSSASWTKPAHATMLSGTDPCVHGIGWNWVGLAGDSAFPGGIVPLPEQLRRAGYATAAFTEDGYVSADTFQRGFDLFATDVHGEWGGPMGAVEDTVARASAWMTANAGVPFFLFVHTYQVHAPYRPPPRYEALAKTVPVPALGGLPPPAEGAMADATAYVGEVAFTDEVVGRLLARIDALGLAERTIVVVTSDHGEAFGEHGNLQHGRTIHREEIRVPLIFRAPGLVAAGRRVTGLVGLVDVTPTVLELLHLPRPPWMQGVSLAAALAPDGDGGVPADRILPIHGFGALGGARAETWKIELGKRPRIWDLADDPGEVRPRRATPGDVSRATRAVEASCTQAKRSLGESASGATGARPGALSIDEQLRLRALGYLE